MQNQHLYIAIPLLDELDNINILLENIKAQTFYNFSLYICVNQPDEWWNNLSKTDICERNIKTINILKKASKESKFPIVVIDKSSKGNGWTNKKNGVGWARKTIIDKINSVATDNDIVISLDGDTQFSNKYFQSIIDNFNQNKNIDTISIPYYHPLDTDEAANRAILRYEIYMRVYLLNLLRIKSPYAFSALGSAIAFKIKALRKIGGFTPKKSGEDFYFLQKMVKYKPISSWNIESVKPMARFSDRVFFGTGPAMIKGKNGNWDSYPIYPLELFDNIKIFYNLIPKLYYSNIETPIDDFLNSITDNINVLWDKLRLNNKDLKHFTKAINDYFDGLRILQYLKYSYKPDNDENSLISFMETIAKEEYIKKLKLKKLSFKNSNISELNEIRDYLCHIENIERKRNLLSYEQ